MHFFSHRDWGNYPETNQTRTIATGIRYARSSVREILAKIYKRHGVVRIPKHYDIQDALMYKEVKYNGERLVEILGKKRSDK